MFINKIDIIPIDKKLKTSFSNAKTVYNQLEGYYVSFLSDGYIGKGEVVILEGFSKESIHDVLWNFEAFKAGLSLNEDLNIEDFLDYIDISIKESGSLKFALETALYDLYCQIKGIPLASFFNPNHCSRIKLSTIYLNNCNRIKYFNTVKLKIGVNSIINDIKSIEKINSENKIKFRLDANQSLSLNDLILIQKNINPAYIEYIEEPFADLDKNKIIDLKSNTSFKIAIDESIYSSKNNNLELIETGLIDYVVLKPSIFGGYKDILEFVKHVKGFNTEIIFSSSLETHIGHMASVHLAACVNNLQEHGLDYYAFYDDCLKHIYKKNDSEISIENINGLGVNF